MKKVTTYEDLLQYAYDSGLFVYELPLEHSSGLIYGKSIGIRSGMDQTSKKCILAEEIGHHERNYGNILDQRDVNNRKQEMRGRRWGYNRLISLMDIAEAAKRGCGNLYDTALFLGVTEEFLEDAITDFRKQYGIMAVVDDFAILFEPCLMVVDVGSLNKKDTPPDY